MHCCMFTLQNHRIILAFKLQYQFTCSAENQMLVFILGFVCGCFLVFLTDGDLPLGVPSNESETY